MTFPRRDLLWAGDLEGVLSGPDEDENKQWLNIRDKSMYFGKCNKMRGSKINTGAKIDPFDS